MSKNLISGLIIVALLVVGGAFLIKNSPSTQKVQISTRMESIPVITKGISKRKAIDSVIPNKIKEIIITGSSFKFDPKTITVKKGQKIKLLFKNAQGNHNLVIDELNARTGLLKAGEEESVDFTADKAGVFKYYCSVGNHRAMGMEGTFTVEE